jgi:hypothetical protein
MITEDAYEFRKQVRRAQELNVFVSLFNFLKDPAKKCFDTDHVSKLAEEIEAEARMKNA